MSFHHQAFTDREASDYRERTLRGLEPPPTFLGIEAHYPCFTASVLLALIVIVLKETLDASGWLVAILGLAAGGFGISGLRLQLVADNFERDQRSVDTELAVASTPELAWILEKGEQFPEIQVEVRRWIAEDRAVRERDVRAIRAYLFKAEPRAEREALLAKLAGLAQPTSSAGSVNDN